MLAALTGCGGDSTSPPPDGPPFQLSDFASPGTCQGCHPTHYAEWSASMHAYSFKDPLFFSGHFAEQERTGGELGQFCIGCHSPIGTLTGTTPDGRFDPQSMPEIVQHGISCDICHSITASTGGATEKGVPLHLSPGNVKYGPLPSRDNGPGVHRSEQNLQLYTNSNHCRACHNLTVRGIPMERTFDEWEESIYASRGDGHCQNCHMPAYTGQAAVGGPIHELGVHRHWFTGVDIAFTDFPDTSASRQRVADLLRDSASLGVTAPAVAAPGETLDVTVTITNDRTGHSLPSGTSFSRQMWVSITAFSGPDTLYRSGHLDANGDLRDEHSEIDPGGDPDLFHFGAKLLGGDDVTVFSATGIEENLIPATRSRTKRFEVPVPMNQPSGFTLEVRLLFRPFPPYKARAEGELEVAARIPIFEMASDTRSIAVQ
jgi:Cytochrome c554 and c-prime